MHRMLACAAAITMAAAAQAQAQDQNTQGEIEALKRRVDELETRSAQKPASNAFNPDISLILQGTAASASQNPDDYHITGFAPSGG